MGSSTYLKLPFSFSGNRQLSARYAALSLCRKKGLLGVVPEGVPPIQLVLPPTSSQSLYKTDCGID